MEVHDWFAQGYEPMNQAWSKIQVVGSVDAVRVAKELMDACADMVALAGELGRAAARSAHTSGGSNGPLTSRRRSRRRPTE